MAPSPDFSFPVELLTEIVKLLPTPDQRTMSLTSQLTRIYAIPSTLPLEIWNIQGKWYQKYKTSIKPVKE